MMDPETIVRALCIVWIPSLWGNSSACVIYNLDDYMMWVLLKGKCVHNSLYPLFHAPKEAFDICDIFVTVVTFSVMSDTSIAFLIFLKRLFLGCGVLKILCPDMHL